MDDNRHMFAAAPRDRLMELQDSPVRMMAVTVNENYMENNRDDDAIYEQEDSDDDELELTRHPIQTDSESDSTEPTSEFSHHPDYLNGAILSDQYRASCGDI